jgi:thiopurine S-methyltransferase
MYKELYIMDNTYWHKKWENNDIAFHEREANPLLVKYLKQLFLTKGSRVFVPLCGKTLDIHWLLLNDYHVAGIELSRIAVEQLFAELGVKPKKTKAGEIERYSARHIDIFVGDIFDLSKKLLGAVDAVYDRAALVALAQNMRQRYAAHLIEITDKAPQLLICFEYDQNLMDGPPFSVTAGEVNKLYKENYNLTLMTSIRVPGGLKGIYSATENAWLLRNS